MNRDGVLAVCPVHTMETLRLPGSASSASASDYREVRQEDLSESSAGAASLTRALPRRSNIANESELEIALPAARVHADHEQQREAPPIDELEARLEILPAADQASQALAAIPDLESPDRFVMPSEADTRQQRLFWLMQLSNAEPTRQLTRLTLLGQLSQLVATGLVLVVCWSRAAACNQDLLFWLVAHLLRLAVSAIVSAALEFGAISHEQADEEAHHHDQPDQSMRDLLVRIEKLLQVGVAFWIVGGLVALDARDCGSGESSRTDTMLVSFVWVVLVIAALAVMSSCMLMLSMLACNPCMPYLIACTRWCRFPQLWQISLADSRRHMRVLAQQAHSDADDVAARARARAFQEVFARASNANRATADEVARLPVLRYHAEQPSSSGEVAASRVDHPSEITRDRHVQLHAQNSNETDQNRGESRSSSSSASESQYMPAQSGALIETSCSICSDDYQCNEGMYTHIYVQICRNVSARAPDRIDIRSIYFMIIF
jgi:hypothetical protein